MVEKKVISDKGSIEVAEYQMYMIESDNGVKVELSESVTCGKCACCGGISRICFGGNVIAFTCDKKDRIKMCVHHHDDSCPGITSCLNKEDFNDTFFTLKKEKVKEIMDAMFTIHDLVMVEIEMESKAIVADHYLKNQEYIVRTLGSSGPEGLEWYVIKKNKKIIENRQKVKENDASAKAEAVKA